MTRLDTNLWWNQKVVVNSVVLKIIFSSMVKYWKMRKIAKQKEYVTLEKIVFLYC